MLILSILFYTFLFVTIIQLYFYGFVFSKFANAKPQKLSTKHIPVSVIICSKNEAKNLNEFLPYILEQDYPNFEVVLINDASTDNTLEIIEDFQKRYNNVKIVNVENNESFWGNKKYALTLGIKASSHDFLLFTDADCKPVSKLWVSEMVSNFDKNTSVILGYGAYAKHKTFLNKLIRFETLMTALQYFSYAKIGIPYMGVGRNLAYKKTLFFKVNGFIDHLDIHSGDDDLFVNQVANRNNTKICFSFNSFTKSLPKTSFKNWIRQKRRHISTVKHYKWIHKIKLGSFYLSQLLFWGLSISLLIFLFQWQIVVSLISLRLIIQYYVLWKSSKKLNEQDMILLLPILELFLILTQLFIFNYNIFSKPKHWK